MTKNSTPERDALAVLGKYIDQGIKISQSTEYGVENGLDLGNLTGPVYDYILWRQELAQWLQQEGFRDESEIFTQPDDVPTLVLGGLEYGYPFSPKSVSRFNSIRREVGRKLKVLRTVRSRLSNKAIPSVESSTLFYLSRTEGLHRIVGGKKQIYPLKGSDERYTILSNLTKSFQGTEDLAKTVCTTSLKLRGQVAGIRKQIESHFIGIRGSDFIESKKGLGYRIGKDFKINEK